MVSLGSNIGALRGIRRLDAASDALRTVLERLSTGQRINKAADDSAGIAIADSLQADSQVYQQAVRNLSDGISLLNIADSAIANLSDIVVRLAELSEQAANGTLGAHQRGSLDQEAQALSAEYSRIIRTTEFNGIHLFSGGPGRISLQAGYSSLEVKLGSVVGTGEFQDAQSYGVGNEPYGVAVADLNGDGIPDLASANYAHNSVSILLGNGDGTFTAGGSLGAVTTPRAVAAGDFNGDGVVDLATANQFDNSVTIHLGNGDGTFAASSLNAGALPISIRVADFDGDGVQDVVTSDTGDDTVSIFLGNGDGTFKPRTSFAAPGNHLLNLGDFNGDGVTDIVTASTSGSGVNILLGNGDGTFAASAYYQAGSAPVSVAVGDFNNDGIQDLVTADFAGNTTSLLLGNGDGTFKAPTTVDGGPVPIFVSAADFNGDGALDLITANYTQASVSVLLGNGDGTFAPRTAYSVGTSPLFVTAADLDGDGVHDLVAANQNGDSISVLLGKAEEGGGVPNLPSFSLGTQGSARQALVEFKKKLLELAEQRGQIGAMQSRIQVATNTLRSIEENFQAAEGRIRDADIAEETSNAVRLNIIRDTASAVLGQANQQPALALQLLS